MILKYEEQMQDQSGMRQYQMETLNVVVEKTTPMSHFIAILDTIVKKVHSGGNANDRIGVKIKFATLDSAFRIVCSTRKNLKSKHLFAAIMREHSQKNLPLIYNTKFEITVRHSSKSILTPLSCYYYCT